VIAAAMPIAPPIERKGIWLEAFPRAINRERVSQRDGDEID
jgi:hypothetical protein